MAPEWVRRTRLVIGIGVPTLLLLGLSAMVVRNGLGPGGWGGLGSGLMMLAAFLGPFPLYAVGLKSTPFTLVIGPALLGVTAWAIYAMFSSESSTAGLALLWIPMIGYPLVGVTIFIEWVSGVD